MVMGMGWGSSHSRRFFKIVVSDWLLPVAALGSRFSTVITGQTHRRSGGSFW
jgi:hypothetical protein